MKKEAKIIGFFMGTLFLLVGCSYNPFYYNRGLTGSAASTAVGAGIGAGTAAIFDASKTLTFFAGLTGGALGYYVSTLRYASGGIIQGGGQVYQVGDLVGIYIPTDQVFEPNTDEFSPQARPVLDSAVAVLVRYPSNNVIISGNTSGFYRARWEQRLSERRAQKVAAYLWQAGINNFNDNSLSMRRLNYVGYGDYFPLSSANYTNEQIRQNSRIQIISYPSNCDLGLGQRDVALHNMGGLDDSDILRAPGCRGEGC